jgi:hypothetical protein
MTLRQAAATIIDPTAHGEEDRAQPLLRCYGSTRR